MAILVERFTLRLGEEKIFLVQGEKQGDLLENFAERRAARIRKERGLPEDMGEIQREEERH